MFNKTKDLSKIISDFYEKYYPEDQQKENKQLPPQNILSFEDTIKKLEKIFLILESPNKETIPYKKRGSSQTPLVFNNHMKIQSNQEIQMNKNEVPHVTFKNYISNQDHSSSTNPLFNNNIFKKT